MSESLVVWWISPTEARVLESRQERVNALPEHICGEVYDLFGRPLRGRLWVPATLSKTFREAGGEIVGWDESPLASRAEVAGGIVVRQSDLEALQAMPGFVSDLELNLIQELN